MKKFLNRWRRDLSGRGALIAGSVAALLMLAPVSGCSGDSDGSPAVNSNGKPVVKGLYVGMSGDDALKACNSLVSSSEDLVVVDFRNGIEREKDEATKAKEKKAYEEAVKLAEADVEKFLKWCNMEGNGYDPSQGGDDIPYRAKKNTPEYIDDLSLPLQDGSVLGLGGTSFPLTAAAELADKHGYQMEWMLPVERKDEKQTETAVPKLFSGKAEVLELKDRSDAYGFWASEILNKGLARDLYANGLQISKDNKNRVFFRLVLEDAQGNPVDKKKLAEELAVNNPSFFEEFNTEQEKIEAAEKEVDGFLIWVELVARDKLSIFDPSDPRTEEEKERTRREEEYIARAAKSGDTRGLEKMNMMRKAQGLPPLAVTADSKSPVDSTPKKAASPQSSGVSAEIKSLKAELAKAEGRKSSLDAEIEKIKHQLNLLASDERQMKGQSPAIMNNPVHRKRRAEIKKKKQETLELYGLAIEKQKETIAVITDIKKQIKNKETIQRQEIAAREKAAADAEAAEKKAAAEAKAAEEAELAKKNRTDLKFLTAARTGVYRNTRSDYALEFSQAMMKMAYSCKVMLEWAVLTEPADKIEEAVETVTLSGDTGDNMMDAMRHIHSAVVHGDNKHLQSNVSKSVVYPHLVRPWFRLVLKTTNGVEVTKAEVAKNWLVARQHYPPNNKLIIPKKNLIQISFKEEGKNEDQLKGLCYVWIDAEGNVKETYFNEDGMNRLFNAGDLSVEEFAQSIVNNYPEIPSLEPEVKRVDPGRGLINETTWIHKDPRGFQVKLFERAYYNNDGVKYNSTMLRNDPEVNLALSLAGKFPTKYFTIFAIKPESARKFD